MRIPLAYISVILLWSTTPLAIKWSGEGSGYLFGVTGRMVIGTVCI
ncbi:MAG: EamA family transporter, partial [Methylobacter sp.]